MFSLRKKDSGHIFEYAQLRVRRHTFQRSTWKKGHFGGMLNLYIKMARRKAPGHAYFPHKVLAAEGKGYFLKIH